MSESEPEVVLVDTPDGASPYQDAYSWDRVPTAQAERERILAILDDPATVEAMARDLERRGFFGWLLSNAHSSLWTRRTPEQEMARVALAVLREWITT